MKFIFSKIFLLSLALTAFMGNAESRSRIKLSHNIIKMQVTSTRGFNLEITDVIKKSGNTTVVIVAQTLGIIQIIPDTIEFSCRRVKAVIKLYGVNCGKTNVSVAAFSLSPRLLPGDNQLLTVEVFQSNDTENIASIMEAFTLIAWLISFYPQILLNHHLQSVAGINFDYVALNVFGTISSSAVNMITAYTPSFREKYSPKYLNSRNPIYPANAFLEIGAIIPLILIIIQCISYKTPERRVSLLVEIMILLNLISSVGLFHIGWSNCLPWLSVIKMWIYTQLICTCLKYMTQLFWNYTRKSTTGWSTQSVLLDLMSGILTFFLIIMDGHNYNNWNFIFQNPAKFGLAVISAVFNVLFIVQQSIYN